MTAFNPPPVGPDWKEWARQIGRVLARQWPNLQWKTQRDIPAENGILLWDETLSYPVVSLSGAFVPVCIRDQLLLRSPNGTLWRIQVSNAGALSAVLA